MFRFSSPSFHSCPFLLLSLVLVGESRLWLFSLDFSHPLNSISSESSRAVVLQYDRDPPSPARVTLFVLFPFPFLLAFLSSLLVVFLSSLLACSGHSLSTYIYIPLVLTAQPDPDLNSFTFIEASHPRSHLICSPRAHRD